MWRGVFVIETIMENWLVVVDQQGGAPEAEATFTGQLDIVRKKG